MTFLDSNIPMYLVGAPHRHKTEAEILVERAIASGDRLVTDAEVLQEILHRYSAMRRRDDIATALRVTLGLVDAVLPMDERDVLRQLRFCAYPSDGPLVMRFTSPSWNGTVFNAS